VKAARVPRRGPGQSFSETQGKQSWGLRTLYQKLLTTLRQKHWKKRQLGHRGIATRKGVSCADAKNIEGETNGTKPFSHQRTAKDFCLI